jgi:hypothetical protein
VATAVARSLLPKNTAISANRYVYIRSFTVSQDQILQSLQAATAQTDAAAKKVLLEWDVVHVDLETKAADANEKLKQWDRRALGFLLSKAIYETGGDFDAEGLAWNEKLGMPKEDDLDTVIREVLEEYD